MYRNCRVLLRKNFLTKSNYQFENQSCYHTQLLRQSIKLHASLLNKQSCILVRSLSFSPALLQATEKIVEESVKKASVAAPSPIQSVHIADPTLSSAVVENAAAVGATAAQNSVPSEVLQEAVQAISKDPALSELGLGNMTPIGWVQIALEWIHTSSGLPWWICICMCTVAIRILMFPVYIKSQKGVAELTKYMPLTHQLHAELTTARQRGDHLEVARVSQELALFMKENKISPFKNMLMPMVQGPVFICFFVGLRGLANAPMPSMRDEGWLWFMDLTVPDQYYLLPLITSLTLLTTIEIGAELGTTSAGYGPYLKYFLRAIPVVIFPFTLHFPSAILVYWTSTNTFSLVQALVFKIPGVKQKLGIPDVSKAKQELKKKEKGFVEEVKSSWSNMKVIQELNERERIDQLQFNRAGREAPVKTYKYDPTKVQPVKAKPKT